MKVQIVDPAAYTPPYNHALSTALAGAGADVELVTSKFTYAEVPSPVGFRATNFFYRRTHKGVSPRVRQLTRLAQHIPDMVRYRRYARRADVVHFQWLPVQQLDVALLPGQRPLILTAHDVLPRESRPGQRRAQRRLYERMDAVIVHSQHGARRLRDELGVDQRLIHVIPHGALHSLTAYPPDAALPPELSQPNKPVVLFFGLLRPYKGVDLLLDAWRQIDGKVDAELWIVGMPRMDISGLRSTAPASIRWVSRYVAGAELAAVFRHADLVVLPYREIDQSGVLFTALAFGKPLLLTAVGGFPEMAQAGAATLVRPNDAEELADGIKQLLIDRARRDALARSSRELAAPDGRYGWASIGHQTTALYRSLLA